MDWKDILVGVGFIGTGCAIYQTSKMRTVAKTLNTSVDAMAGMTKVSIQDEMVKRAVEKAVGREVEDAVRQASKRIREDVFTDMCVKVRKAVQSAYSDLQAPVRDQIAKQVENIQMDALKKAVTQEAKQAIVNKFEGCLDEVMDNFKDNLGNIAKIYGSVAESLTGKPRQEIVLRIK